MTHVWTPPRKRHSLPFAEASRPTWLELFYDLVYVAVFIQIGELLGADVSWAGVGRVLVLFVPLWWVWANFAWYMNQFHVDDVLHRALLVVQIFFVAWMGITVGGAFAEASTAFVLCAIGFRLTMIAMYARSIRHWPEARPVLERYIVAYHVVGAAGWAASLALPAGQRWIVWMAVFGWELAMSHSRGMATLLRRFPPHLGHLAERYGTLIILVLGESFIKSITVSPSPAMTAGAVVYSLPGVVLVFALWWLYFEDAHVEEPGGAEGFGVLASGREVPWLYLHLPLSLAIIAFGVAKMKLFEASAGGALSAEYVAMFLGSLAAYCVLLAVIARDRTGHDTVWRLGSAVALLALVPVVVAREWSATALMLAATAVVAGQVVREAWQARALDGRRARRG